MSVMNPDMDVRMMVANWPEDAPRGAVAAFCRKHGVSTSWFHKVRADVRAHGVWSALELGSTRPRVSPSATASEMVRLALEVRQELRDAGHDFGPLSVQARLRRRGLQPPSRATLARIFSRAGVVVPEPRKKPRSAYRRFTYPAPNCCWQIDATDWTLLNGRVVSIFQIVDDHSRLALASLVETGETSAGAIAVVKTAIARHGVPQKFLSDNGPAFNPSRRGQRGRLVEYLTSMGVEPITGKPYKPTTQGKNERFHQTLHRYLNAQPPATTMAELQAHIDTFDIYYNTEREHQALPPWMTPTDAWNATATADPPLPPADAPRRDWVQLQRVVQPKGVVRVAGTRYQVGNEHAATTVHIVHDTTTVTFYDTTGTPIISYPLAAKGTSYVGNGKSSPPQLRTLSTKS